MVGNCKDFLSHDQLEPCEAAAVLVSPGPVDPALALPVVQRQESYCGRPEVLLEEEAQMHRGGVGQEGGQIEDSSDAVIHHHLNEEKHMWSRFLGGQ